MSNRNRTKGFNYERKIVKELNEMGYKVGTSRLLSKYMDDNKVDIIDYPDTTVPLPVFIQCKSVTGNINLNEIFDGFTLTGKPLVIFHEKNVKNGKKFMKCGEYVIMKKESFYELIRKE